MVVAIAVGLIAVTAASCGGTGSGSAGGGKSGAARTGEFADGFREITGAYQLRTKVLQEEGKNAAGQGQTRVLAVYESMRSAAHEAREGYEKLRAPRDLAPTFKHLLGVLEQQEKAIGAVLNAARGGDGALLTSSLQQLATSLTEWAAARADIESRIEAAS